MSTKPTAEAAA